MSQPALAPPTTVGVLLVLGHALHVRNFVVSDLADELRERGLRVAVIAPHQTLARLRQFVPQLREEDLHALEPVATSTRRRKLLQWLRLGSFVSRRSASEYREKLAWSARTGPLELLVLLGWFGIALWTDPERLARMWVGRLRASQTARRLLRAISPKLVLWATTISDPIDFEIVQAADELRIPLVMCEGSWDNLVTKGAIWPRPARVLVWGDYSRQHALQHHRFLDGEVVVTGPPHFDVYADPRRLMPRTEWYARHGLDPARRLIFLGGTTWASEAEPSLLRMISEWIETGTLPPAYIWYRPHPRGKTQTWVRQGGAGAIPHVVLDPGLRTEQVGPGVVWTIHPEEAVQRANALAACDVLVSMFSTVVLEGALLGKPTVLVEFLQIDGNGPARKFRFHRFSHVQHLARAPWMRTAADMEELREGLRVLLTSKPEAMAVELRRFALTTANCGDGLACARIAGAIEAILDGRATVPLHA